MTPRDQLVYAAQRIRAHAASVSDVDPWADEHLGRIAERLESAADVAAPPLGIPPSIFEIESRYA